MTSKPKLFITRFWTLLILLVCMQFKVFAGDKDFPPRPDPPQLVNDLAHILTADQVTQLEAKLENYANTTSTQVAIVTITDIGDYDIAEYATKLFNKWGIGQKDKKNGVLIIAAINNHKINISTGGGVQGDLTDALCGRIIRNEMTPPFKQGNYYEGFSRAADAVIAATKGEYKADGKTGKRDIPLKWVIALIVLIYLVLWFLSKIGGGGGGGGSYMSGRGLGAFGAGWFLGGGGFGGGGFGGGGSGGGGFGGFGGGGSDGGGASGGW